MNEYTVKGSKFHGKTVFYTGNSLRIAVKIARKHDCRTCKCGGPTIERNDSAVYLDWSVTPPFQIANTPWWEII